LACTERRSRSCGLLRRKIAITHVTVIDVRTGTNKKDMTVLIVGDRISAIRAGKEKEKLPTKEIEVIDGQGKYLIPGLWDMHAHTGGNDRVLR
jgi:imidazolonepropionase-like amidohydrolase